MLSGGGLKGVCVCGGGGGGFFSRIKKSEYSAYNRLFSLKYEIYTGYIYIYMYVHIYIFISFFQVVQSVCVCVCVVRTVPWRKPWHSSTFSIKLCYSINYLTHMI